MQMGEFQVHVLTVELADPDDVGTQVDQSVGTPGACEHTGEVEDADAV